MAKARIVHLICTFLAVLAFVSEPDYLIFAIVIIMTYNSWNLYQDKNYDG